MENKNLTKLKEEYTNCQKCPELCESKIQVVFGSGNPNADIMLIGEAPGLNEAKQGIPFCGASGKILQELLGSIGYTRNDVFITNTVICRPPKNRNPKAQEIKNCHDRLHQTIQAINPKVIVTIGNFATKKITGTKEGITKLRGTSIQINIQENIYTIIPVIHPANLLYNGRNPKILQHMKDDFQVIKKTIDIQTN